MEVSDGAMYDISTLPISLEMCQSDQSQTDRVPVTEEAIIETCSVSEQQQNLLHFETICPSKIVTTSAWKPSIVQCIPLSNELALWRKFSYLI